MYTVTNTNPHHGDAIPPAPQTLSLGTNTHIWALPGFDYQV